MDGLMTQRMTHERSKAMRAKICVNPNQKLGQCVMKNLLKLFNAIQLR